MNEQEKQDQEEIELDYSRQYYSNVMNNILEANDLYPDPVEFSTKANAELNGAISVIPPEYKKSMSIVPSIAIDTLSQDKIDNKALENLEEAEERNDLYIYEAKDAAEKASEKDLPILVQAGVTSMFLAGLDEEHKRGKMKLSEVKQLQLDYARNIAFSTFEKYLTSDEISSQGKLELIDRFAKGETGDESIDKYSNSYERAQYIEQALDFVNKRDAYKEKLRQQEELQRKEKFLEEYNNAIDYLATENYSIYDLRNKQKWLMVWAKTPEEIQQISELENYVNPKSTSPLVIVILEEAKRDGTLKEKVEYFKSTGQLTGSDAKKYINDLYNPINTNLDTAVAKASIDAAKVNFSDKPELYNVWYDNFISSLSNNVLTDKEIRDAAKDAYSSLGPRGQETKIGQLTEKLMDETRNGISDTNFNSIVNNASARITNKYNLSSPLDLDENGLKEVETETKKGFVEHYQKQTSNGKEIFIIGNDGEKITNKEIIIEFWMAKAKQKLEMQKGL